MAEKTKRRRAYVMLEGITSLQKAKAIAELARTGSKDAACRASDISPTYVEKLIELDLEFARSWEEAKSEAVGKLEALTMDIALNGWQKVIMTRQGPMTTIDPETGESKVVTTTERDLKFLLAVLAALNPQKWGTYAGQQPQALPEDLKPDPAPKPDEPGPDDVPAETK